MFRVIIDMTSSPVHLTGTSSLSQAVHAALANVIQDPLITATGDPCVTNHQSMGGGDSSINNANRCENCSKLRQQLTLLIYEVLNLENTMESKICEYVQRRLSEIAISEQLANNSPSKIITTGDIKQPTPPMDSTLTNNENIGRNIN
jgi:hypothetical protein